MNYVRMRGASQNEIWAITPATEDMVKRGLMDMVPDAEAKIIIAKLTASVKPLSPVAEAEIVKIVETMVEEAPVEEVPVEETPVEEAPVEEPLVEEAPVEEPLVEEAPEEEPLVEEAPEEEAHTPIFTSKAPTKKAKK